MITYTNIRNNSGVIYPDEPRQRTISDALQAMLIYEFGYGASLVELTQTKIVVRTSIFATTDTVTFEGNETDMALLVEAAYLAMSYHPMKRDAEPLYQEKAIDAIMRVTGGKPLLVAHMSGILLGTTTIKAALIHMIGTTDDNMVCQLIKIDPKTLLAIMMLVRQDQVSVQDAFELAVAAPAYEQDGKICGLTAAAA